MRGSVSFWVAALVMLVTNVTTVPEKGPYEIIIKRVEVCEDMGTNQVKFGTKMRSQGNGVLVYSDDLELEIPWDDEIKVYLEYYKVDFEVHHLRNGVYTKIYTGNLKNCEKIRKYGKDTLKSFFHAAGYNFTSCPLPAGKYPVRNWPLQNLTMSNVPTLPYGSFKTVSIYSKEKKRVGCFQIFGDIVPKRT